MKKTINLFFLMLVACVMTSCWSVKSISVVDIPERFAGNKHDYLVGMTRAQVYEEMSLPNRVEDNGAGGKILVYETVEHITENIQKHTYSASASAASKGASSAAAVAGNGVAVGAGNSATVAGMQANENSTNSSVVTTKENRTYVNVFINQDDICYKVKANFGDIYEPAVTHTECFKWPSGWNLFWLCPPFTPVGIFTSIWYFKQAEKLEKNPIPLECK